MNIHQQVEDCDSESQLQGSVVKKKQALGIVHVSYSRASYKVVAFMIGMKKNHTIFIICPYFMKKMWHVRQGQ